jgi:GT2 family glycosyltransferase
MDSVATSECPVRLSSVVLSWNSARHIEACVRSLVDESDGHSDEIWVVDNGSTDGTVEILARLADEHSGVLRVIYLDRNLGTTVSRNLALKQVRGSYVAIIDSDVIVPRGTIAPLVARLSSEPSCGVLAPRLLYPNGQLQMSTDVFPTVARKLRRLFTLKAMERRLDAAGMPQQRTTVDYAISAFWVMRREVLEAVGLLDERIFYSPEDADYCLRVWSAGYTVMYDPSVHAIHYAQEISRGFRPSRAALSHAAGLMYFFRKHRYVVSRRRLYRRFEELRAGQTT